MQADFIEFSNSVVTLQNFSIEIMFLLYVISAFRSGAKYSEYKPAFAFLVLIAGASMTRAWSWLWIWQVNRGIWIGWMDAFPVNPVGLVVTLIGTSCVLRIFSPKRWSTLIWVGSLASSIALSVLSFLIDK